MGRRTKPFKPLDDVIAATREKLRLGEYDWLKELAAAHKVGVHRLINYGCHNGAETFALVVMLDSQMAVGVDANLDSLKRGQKSIEDATHGESAIIKRNTIVAFVGTDIVEGIGLRADYFDVGYCANVLDQVVGDAVESPIEDLRHAVTEMVRVIQPGGIVVVEGKVANKTGESPDLEPLFRRLGMEILPVPNDDARVRRAYRKQGALLSAAQTPRPI